MDLPQVQLGQHCSAKWTTFSTVLCIRSAHKNEPRTAPYFFTPHPTSSHRTLLLLDRLLPLSRYLSYRSLLLHWFGDGGGFGRLDRTRAGPLAARSPPSPSLSVTAHKTHLLSSPLLSLSLWTTHDTKMGRYGLPHFISCWNWSSSRSRPRRFPCRLRSNDPSAWRGVGLLGHEQIRFP